MKNSAGPPIRSEVWKLRGSLNLTPPVIRPTRTKPASPESGQTSPVLRAIVLITVSI